MKSSATTSRIVISLMTIFFFSMSSCSDDSEVTKDDDDTDTDTEVTIPVDPNFDTNTQEISLDDAVTVTYSGTAVVVTNPFVTEGVTAEVKDGDVVITSTITDKEINYVLSGHATNGSFKIYSDNKFNLVLDGVDIINDDGPAINIQSGKKASVNVLESTHNRLIDGGSYATSLEDQKGTFFSEGQLVFSGKGSLLVYGNYKHAIASDDYISITEGEVTIATAASDGIHANDYFKQIDGSLTVISSGDGIDAAEGYIEISGGTVNVTAADEGISASYDGEDVAIIPYVEITGGSIEVATSGDKSGAIKSESDIVINSTGSLILTATGKGSKGLKSNGNISIASGDITITTFGDSFYDTEDAGIASSAGISCDGNLNIDGGLLSITSTGSGGKGISVDAAITVNGGTSSITASGSDFAYNRTTTSEAKGVKADGEIIVNDGSLTISATDDGMKSEKSITTNGGALTITKSTEGIEAPLITFNNGSITVASSDDCVNGTYGNGGEGNDNSLVTFAGGIVLLNSSGGDAIDSNGNIIMTGGTVVSQGPASAPELALDYNGTFKISGGLLIGSGPNSGNMIEATSTSSSQYAMLVKFSSIVSANTIFNIQDASGNSLVSYKPSRNAYYFVFSSSALVSGAAYKVYTGGSLSGGTVSNGLTVGGTYTNGTLRGTFNLNNKVTTATL